MVDKNYCLNSFLMYRTIADRSKSFNESPFYFVDIGERKKICSSQELEKYLRERVVETCKTRRAALCLSGGIDSGILAKFMPEGSVAYTFKCTVEGRSDTVDETPGARRYAEECGLEQRVVEIYWRDFEELLPDVMKHKNLPVHSIEVQIYKAALQAKKDGFDTLIFGESSDVIYGGLDGLLSKDWLAGDFIDRYTYVMPYKALYEPQLILEPYMQYEKDGHIDPHSFVSEFFRTEGLMSYYNATDTAGMGLVCPFAETVLGVPIDYTRIRNGENKYFVREVFKRLYPDFPIPKKTPMPRPMDIWMSDWNGPTRPEFMPHCTDNMTGDQKWLVYCLERFLNIMNIK